MVIPPLIRLDAYRDKSGERVVDDDAGSPCLAGHYHLKIALLHGVLIVRHRVLNCQFVGILREEKRNILTIRGLGVRIGLYAVRVELGSGNDLFKIGSVLKYEILNRGIGMIDTTSGDVDEHVGGKSEGVGSLHVLGVS